MPDWNVDAWRQIQESLHRLRAEVRLPKNIVFARAFFDQMVKDMMFVKCEDTGIATLAGVPFEITDDPLAPDYSIDYEEEVTFKFISRRRSDYRTWASPL